MELQGFKMKHFSAEEFETILRMNQCDAIDAELEPEPELIPRRPANFSFRIHAPAGAGRRLECAVTDTAWAIG